MVLDVGFGLETPTTLAVLCLGTRKLLPSLLLPRQDIHALTHSHTHTHTPPQDAKRAIEIAKTIAEGGAATGEKGEGEHGHTSVIQHAAEHHGNTTAPVAKRVPSPSTPEKMQG